MLTAALLRAGASPTGARQLEDDAYVLPRPRAAVGVAHLGTKHQRTIVLSRAPTATAASSLPIADPASESGR